MPDRGLGNAVQARDVLEQVARAAVAEWTQQNPRQAKTEIPPLFKWLAGIAAGVLVFAITASTAWGVSTLNSLQITVARMDERQQRDTTPQRLDKIEDRLARLERPKQEEN